MSEVQTLARGLKILDLLAESTDGFLSSELADTLGLDKGAMSRLMQTLVKYGYADRDPGTRRYYVGSRLHTIGTQAGQYASLRELALPQLEKLSQQTTENAHLAILDAEQAVTIADVASQQTLRVVSEVGRRMPLNASAVGKCLLAFIDVPALRELNRYTEQTLITPKKLAVELENIRLSQHAVDNEELTIGVRGLAVPVRNREGRVIASMGVSGPAVRVSAQNDKSFFALLDESAAIMSEQLGYLDATP